MSALLTFIDTLVEHHFVKENVIQAGYPLDMRYAGPREGLLHATFRQNYGVNNSVVAEEGRIPFPPLSGTKK